MKSYRNPAEEIDLSHIYRPLLVTLIIAVSFTSPLHRLDSFGFPTDDLSNSDGALVTAPLCGGYVPGPKLIDSNAKGAYYVLGAVGGGDITLVYDAAFPVEGRSYAQALFDLVYPEIKRIYADPSNTITVTLRYDPTVYPWNYYYGAIHTIVMSQLPPSSGTSPTWDAVFTHELIHAFHDAIVLTGGSWAEEGMAEAVTEIVAMNLGGRRNIVFRDPVINLKYYDVWGYMGSNVLGGGPDFTYKVNPDLSYRISSAMFFILTTDVSTNPSNPYDFLARLNNAIYADAASNPYFDDLRFKMKIRQVAAGRLVEGQLADVWVGNQPITASFVRTGFQIGAYPYRPETPTRVWAITFLRQSDGRETPLGSVQVSVRVIDSLGRIISTGILSTGSDGMGYVDLTPTPLSAGGYQIIASTIFNSVNYTTRNYAFSQGTSTLIEQADINLYGVTLDYQGRPVAGTVTAAGGTVKMNTQGAFKIEASSQTVPFELTVTSGTMERKFGKPNPYTRVVWSNSTAAAPTPYTVTVSVAGLPSTYSTTLRVDGSTRGVIQGGGSTVLTFDPGTTHTVGVDSYVNASSTERYRCVNTLQTATSTVTLVFTYLKEFYAKFQQSGSARPVSATIDGSIHALPVSFWWVNGSTHTFTYQSNVTESSTRYVLTGVSHYSPILIQQTLTVTGSYKTQYLLNLSTLPAGLVTLNGSGWYDAGSKANVVAPNVPNYTFKNWIIDGAQQVTSNPIQIDMNAPHKAVAQYQSTGVYDVTIAALHAPNNEQTEVVFTWDGQTYTTPRTFSGVSGTHALVMSPADKLGRPFARWQDLTSNVTSRTISAGGTYTALFGAVTKDFTIAASPELQRIGPGQSTSFTLKLESVSGFSSPVTLGVKGLPVNTNSAFNPRTLTPPGTSTLTVNTLPTTPVGSYILTITATGDSLVRTVMVRLSMGACIVATATYGSELTPEVQFLRSFRDNTVRGTFAGENFMFAFNLWYYSFSPPVADFIKASGPVRTLARIVLYPLIGILHLSSAAYVLFASAPELAVFVSGAVASHLIGTVYFAPVLTPFLLGRRRWRPKLWKSTALILSGSIVASLLGEVCAYWGLMILGTSTFVIGVLVLSVLTLTELLSSIGHARKNKPMRLGKWSFLKCEVS